jgi:CRISPR-associated protein Cas5h
MKQLISFDIKADFGFLKKPDTNAPVYLTYNMIHKPCVLGLLGAIMGYDGFKRNKEKPEYYRILCDERPVKIGIQPLNHEKGNFQKTTVKYNNSTGSANLSSIKSLAEKPKDVFSIGATLNIIEQILIRPSYRIYLLTDNQELIRRIQNCEAEFLPYLGKNDFSLWWENVQKYDYEEFEPQGGYKINSLFIKRSTIKNGKEEAHDLDFWEMDFTGGEFMYFERLPIGYDEELYQYEYRPFAYTTFKLKKEYKIDNLYQLNKNEIIQVF